MTPQSNFMVLAPIDPPREAELRALLDSMNEAPGRVNPNNALIPFAQFDPLHYARLLILDDQTTGDVSVYGLDARDLSALSRVSRRHRWGRGIVSRAVGLPRARGIARALLLLRRFHASRPISLGG